MDIYTLSRMTARRFLKNTDIKVPFDIYMGLTYLNTNLRYQHFDSIGAVLFFSNQKRLIIANLNYGVELQRFFIAHEMGHILLGHKKTSYCQPEKYHKEKSYKEKLADVCARELLIPTHYLKIYGKEYGYNVKILKGIFCVSELDIVIKLRNLGLPYWNTVYRNF